MDLRRQMDMWKGRRLSRKGILESLRKARGSRTYSVEIVQVL